MVKCSVNHSIRESVSFSESVSQSVGLTSYPGVFCQSIEFKFACVFEKGAGIFLTFTSCVSGISF